MSAVTTHNPGQALPDVDGWVHGIKSDDPWTVQCDDCLTCFTGTWLLGVAKKALFNQRSGVPGLRLCAECWKERGWVDAYEGWTEVRS